MLFKSENIDLNLFKKESNIRNAKYGLPTEVKFCKDCIMSNQRPNSAVEFNHSNLSKKETIGFNEVGVCDACTFSFKKKDTIDWNDKEKELIELCNKYRRNDGRYDCVVPGSGGKDSFYASHVLKYKYNMHPLTVTWAPHIHTPWGWKNFQSWIHSGFDNHMITPNGKVHRLLTRLAVETIFHPFQPFMLGQKTIAPRIAIAFDIPLIFYGENEAEYGNPIDENDTSLRSKDFFARDERKNVKISGVDYNDLINQFKLDASELELYMPVDLNQINEKNINVHYLGYYLPWHPQEAYYYSVEKGNFQASPERTAGTYSKYNSIDDKIDDFHFYTYYIKFGIGRATYDAAQEIRNEDITREEGVALVKKFDGEFPHRFSEEIFNYLSIHPDEFGKVSNFFEDPIMNYDTFHKLADTFRSPHIWYYEDGWKLRSTIYK